MKVDNESGVLVSLDIGPPRSFACGPHTDALQPPAPNAPMPPNAPLPSCSRVAASFNKTDASNGL